MTATKPISRSECSPKFREDLIVSRQEAAGRTYFVVKDPVTQRFFRLNQAECFIAEQLDGESSLEEIRRFIGRELGIDYPLEKLERFVEKLAKLCLIEEKRTEQEISRKQHEESDKQKGLGRLLYIRLKAVDPKRFFDAIMPYVGFFFTRGFVRFSMLLSLAALWISMDRWEEYTHQMLRLVTPEAIPLVIVLLLVVTGLHELAHGAACRRFGGSMNEIGFLLIYLVPAFYCNVSDAWLFREKSKRLWVSFAGIYFQVVVWAAATVAWRFIDPETWLSDLCCLTMAASGLTTLFNFNPLIKLDGYYMLSDWLEIPNLRREAFDYLGGRLRALVGFREEKAAETRIREQRIFVLYGVMAGVYSLGLLAFILYHVAVFIVSEIHVIALCLPAVIMLVLLTSRALSWKERIRSIFIFNEVNKMGRKRRIGFWIVFGATVLSLIFCTWELKVTGDFQLLPYSRASLRPEVAGIVDQIFVREGDWVARNAPIASLDATEHIADMQKTEAEIAEKTARLEMLKKGPTTEQIGRIEKRIEEERIKVEIAKKRLARITDLHEKDLIPFIDFEKAQGDLDVLRKQLERAQSDLDVLLTENRVEIIRAAESELDRLDTAYCFLKEHVKRTTMNSPISGIVLTHRLEDKRKEYLDVGDELCQIGGCQVMLCEITVSEKDVSEVIVGQEVKLKAWSLPGDAFYGTVAAISPQATLNDSKTVVIVTSEVDNASMLLRPGMTGKAKIYCGERRIIRLLTRKIVNFIRVKFCW
ncbi:MAG: efflux RND transporter periplasmic adaptor subunit [Planctomycetota bacterium]